MANPLILVPGEEGASQMLMPGAMSSLAFSGKLDPNSITSFIVGTWYPLGANPRESFTAYLLYNLPYCA